MNILSDMHHQDLYHSLQLLFEKRLKHNLFRPIGLDWYKEGFWNVYPSPDTAEQYLGMRQGYQPKDGTLPLNNIGGVWKDIYLCEDKHNDTYNIAITLDVFKKIDIDIVIASIPQHIKPFKELAKMKSAKFIFQQGNMFTEVLNNLHEIPNLLSSTVAFPVPPSCNAVFYHQEFDTDIFKPTSKPPERLITSFINVYHDNGGFEDYMSLKAALPDYEFKSYGAQNQDGIMNTTQEIATAIQNSAFGFHSKRMGDGFGHIIWNWAFVGKPLITRISDYKEKIAEPLLTHGETCIDLDTCNYNEACDMITNMPQYKYEYMCQEIRRRALKEADFDKEEIKIREFLENLK